MTTPWYGAIEAGGTKFICAVGTGPENIRAQVRIPTTTPAETMAAVFDFFDAQVKEVDLAAIGIASFGPVDLHKDSATWGYITTTPKPHWANANIGQAVRDRYNVPVGFDTDVNGVILAEARWGAAQGLNSAVYFTIGTGVGGGGVIDGQLMHGLVHPEMGHMRIPHDLQKDPYAGHCPFHQDCFEGLASGPAIEARWGVKGDALGVDHAAWELEADYIALAMMNIACVLSPQRIILGGGVMQQAQLFPMIRAKLQTYLNGYIQDAAILENMDTYVVPPQLGDVAGICGGLALAMDA